ncbi:MAG: hypothetical protein WA802_06180 [Terracidiphilus sp.]
MILGLSTLAFTLLHVILSLAGISAGFIVVLGLMDGELLPRWTVFFLATTILTNVSGFLFPFKGVTPGIVLGVLSTIALLVAIVALYGKKLSGGWRGSFVITTCLALYFNVFVLIAQLFAKAPALKAIAPAPTSPVFGATQLVVLAAFIFLTMRTLKGFRPEAD